MRQHGAKPLSHSFTFAQGVGRSTVSPQHADLVGMSTSETPTRTRPKNYTYLKQIIKHITT
ncbi:MAG: hypothetical protein RML94_10510 [Bacteroidia bacterium]|nr:hypothetical protein [Bacteroidia bacterium]